MYKDDTTNFINTHHVEDAMIDINDLRRKVNSTDIVDHIDLHANIKPFLSELLDRLEAAEKEIDALRAKIEAAEKSDAESIAMYRKARDERDDLRTKISDLTINVEYLGNLKKSYEELIGELQDDRDALRADKATLQQMTYSLKDRLEVAEKDSAHSKALAESALRVAKGWEDKCDELRAKIEQMERQEPAYWGPKHAIEGGSTTVIVGKFPVNPTDAPLYALPGAKGEEE